MLPLAPLVPFPPFAAFPVTPEVAEAGKLPVPLEDILLIEVVEEELGWTVTTVVSAAPAPAPAVASEDDNDEAEEPVLPLPLVEEEPAPAAAEEEEEEPELEPVPLLVPLPLPLSGLPPTIAPVPHGMACPFGCVWFGAATCIKCIRSGVRVKVKADKHSQSFRRQLRS